MCIYKYIPGPDPLLIMETVKYFCGANCLVFYARNSRCFVTELRIKTTLGIRYLATFPNLKHRYVLYSNTILVI